MSVGAVKTKQIAKRTGWQAFVSCNIPGDSSDGLRPAVENAIIKECKSMVAEAAAKAAEATEATALAPPLLAEN